ncbi:hypothetical protein PO878_10790 [Iamia majanohamensis]|uniref:Uncharacterized protein n=1 Tax=Iamia majanohamensis TaxID=467976 RepID=A0AAE9YE83_9ACTN|nr:hypothetical protein [Iamia majanohamensis]WCO69209.1 hypothetical protein PO878_10790 [Iamia majanohamensis]
MRRRSVAVTWCAALALLGATLGCSGGSDDDDPLAALGRAGLDPGSVTALVGRAAHDPGEGAPVAQYFNLRRLRTGAGLADDLEGEELVEEAFLDEMADGTPAEPYSALIRLALEEPGVLPLSRVAATYTDLTVPGSVLLGDWDPEAVAEAYAEVVGPVEEEQADGYRVLRAADEAPEGDDGGSGDPVATRVYSEAAVALSSDGAEVVFGAEGDGLGALADDEEDTALALPGVDEVAAALDAAAVYTAALFLDVGSVGGEGPLPEPWSTGAVATGFDDEAGSTAYAVLWHEDDAAAEANAEALAEELEATDRCREPASTTVDGSLLVGSCAFDGRWVSEVVGRYPLGPLFS